MMTKAITPMKVLGVCSRKINERHHDIGPAVLMLWATYLTRQ